MSPDRAQIAQDLDVACRRALIRFRVLAFDNIDVNVFSAEQPISRDNAEWMGRHLLRHSRDLKAYKSGQHILKLAKSLHVA